jgi:RNA polymerase sigma factor for flagellar operon FliA
VPESPRTTEALRDLWKRWHERRDPVAREKLIVAYAPLVKWIAGRVASTLPAHIEEGDLISFGLLGLSSAVDRYDAERKVKFETYAATRIHGAIIDELRSEDWVPRSVRQRARQIERAHAVLEHRLHRVPTDEELAAELSITVEEFRESLLLVAQSRMHALDEMWSAGDGSGEAVSLLEVLEDADAVDPVAAVAAQSLRDEIGDAIQRLPEREKVVVALYYYENLTLREIGEVLGVTESRASQLHSKAVLRLRSRLSSGGPETG